MNVELTRYLTSVLRKEMGAQSLNHSIDSESLETQKCKDSNINLFLMESKFALRLDEII